MKIITQEFIHILDKIWEIHYNGHTYYRHQYLGGLIKWTPFKLPKYSATKYTECENSEELEKEFLQIEQNLDLPNWKGRD